MKKEKTAPKKKTGGKEKKIVCMTPVGRLSFPYLAKPDEGRQYSDGKYKTDLIIPKEIWERDGKTLVEEVLNLARKKFDDPKLKLKDFKHPFKDCDADKDFLAKNPFAKGCIMLRAKSGYAPIVVGPTKDKFDSEEIAKIKGGDYGRLIVTVFHYSQQGGGISLALNIVQFAKEGEALGGGAAKMLEILDEMEMEDPTSESEDEADDEKEEDDSEDEDESEEDEHSFA